MPLLNLPAEIHQHIISHLLSARDVANLSLQCHALHAMCDMATRKRYNQICINPRRQNIDRGFKLLLNILQRPGLGHLVRHIEYCHPFPDRGLPEYKERGFERELSDEDMGLLRNAVRKAGFTEHRENRIINMLMQTEAPRSYFGDLYARDSIAFTTQALAALLVTVSPNLVSIAMTQPFWGRWDKIKPVEFPLDQLFRAANASADDKPYLQNLRKVYMINKKDMEDDRIYQYIDFLGCFSLFDCLPSIEWVGTDILEEDENGKPDLLTGSSNISRICVKNSSALGSTYLTKMIVSCKTLKEFQFTIGGRASFGGGYFNPKAFFKALCMHKKTLETMHVDVEDHVYDIPQRDDDELDDYWDIDKGRRPWHDARTIKFLATFWQNDGSLKEFTALKELSLGVGLLTYFARGTKRTEGMLADNLPRSLERLTIFGYEEGEDEALDEQVEKLREFMKSDTCNLKHVSGIDEPIPHAQDVKNLMIKRYYYGSGKELAMRPMRPMRLVRHYFWIIHLAHDSVDVSFVFIPNI